MFFCNQQGERVATGLHDPPINAATVAAAWRPAQQIAWFGQRFLWQSVCNVRSPAIASGFVRWFSQLSGDFASRGPIPQWGRRSNVAGGALYRAVGMAGRVDGLYAAGIDLQSFALDSSKATAHLVPYGRISAHCYELNCHVGLRISRGVLCNHGG